MKPPKVFFISEDGDKIKPPYLCAENQDEAQKWIEDQYHLAAKAFDLHEISGYQEIMRTLGIHGGLLNQKGIQFCNEKDTPEVCPCNSRENKYCWLS